MSNLYKIFICIILLLCLTTCSIKRVNNFPINLSNLVYLEINADLDFSSSEMLEIYQAAEEWEIATRGIVRIKINRLNINNKSVSSFGNENLLIKVDSSHELIATKDLTNNFTTTGFTYFSNNEKDNFYIGIAYDKITNQISLKQLVMHEIGHALKLNHNRNDISVMASPLFKNVNCLSKGDMIEFCGKYNCWHEQMNYCDPLLLRNQFSE